jgi:hypothetical protein
MSKQKTPTLIDFARHKSNQEVVIINLITFGLLVLLAICAILYDSGPVILILGLFAAAGVFSATILITRKSRNVAIEKGNMKSNWTISLPEKQRDKLNSEVWEIAETMKIPDEQYSDLLLTYIVAEDLALRHIQQEVEQPLIRHARIGETEFDAISLSNNLITCVEVTFLVAPELSDDKIARLRKKMSSARAIVNKDFAGSNLKLMLFIVYQLDAMGEAKLRSVLTKDRFASIPINYFEIELRSFEELQERYTMD